MALSAPSDTATVVVTCASSGIGGAFARELAGRGHHVTLIARRRERLKAIAAELGNGATILPADLASRRARDRVIARLSDGGRDVAGLVNSAGVGGFGAVVE